MSTGFGSDPKYRLAQSAWVFPSMQRTICTAATLQAAVLVGASSFVQTELPVSQSVGTFQVLQLRSLHWQMTSSTHAVHASWAGAPPGRSQALDAAAHAGAASGVAVMSSSLPPHEETSTQLEMSARATLPHKGRRWVALTSTVCPTRPPCALFPGVSLRSTSSRANSRARPDDSLRVASDATVVEKTETSR
jgi:hypothetical protein